MRDGGIKLRTIDTGEDRRYRWTYAGEHTAGRRIPREDDTSGLLVSNRGEVPYYREHIIGRVFRYFLVNDLQWPLAIRICQK